VAPPPMQLAILFAGATSIFFFFFVLGLLVGALVKPFALSARTAHLVSVLCPWSLMVLAEFRVRRRSPSFSHTAQPRAHDISCFCYRAHFTFTASGTGASSIPEERLAWAFHGWHHAAFFFFGSVVRVFFGPRVAAPPRLPSPFLGDLWRFAGRRCGGIWQIGVLRPEEGRAAFGGGTHNGP